MILCDQPAREVFCWYWLVAMAPSSLPMPQPARLRSLAILGALMYAQPVYGLPTPACSLPIRLQRSIAVYTTGHEHCDEPGSQAAIAGNHMHCPRWRWTDDDDTVSTIPVLASPRQQLQQLCLRSRWNDGHVHVGQRLLHKLLRTSTLAIWQLLG